MQKGIQDFKKFYVEGVDIRFYIIRYFFIDLVGYVVRLGF